MEPRASPPRSEQPVIALARRTLARRACGVSWPRLPRPESRYQRSSVNRIEPTYTASAQEAVRTVRRKQQPVALPAALRHRHRQGVRRTKRPARSRAHQRHVLRTAAAAVRDSRRRPAPRTKLPDPRTNHRHSRSATRCTLRSVSERLRAPPNRNSEVPARRARRRILTMACALLGGAPQSLHCHPQATPVRAPRPALLGDACGQLLPASSSLRQPSCSPAPRHQLQRFPHSRLHHHDHLLLGALRADPGAAQARQRGVVIQCRNHHREACWRG